MRRDPIIKFKRAVLATAKIAIIPNAADGNQGAVTRATSINGASDTAKSEALIADMAIRLIPM